MELSFYEILGYVSSIIIVISMMMNSLIRLRIVNMTGAFLFSVYGFLIGAYPVGVLNGIIVFVNLYQLYKLYSRKEDFRIIQPQMHDEFIQAFVDHYKKEIKHFQPDFDFNLNKIDVVFIILRNMNVAGLVLGTNLPEQNLKINLDFVIPEYRDMKIGQFLFVENKEYIKDKNISRIITTAKNDAHAEYLRKIGFTYNPTEDVYELKI